MTTLLSDRVRLIRGLQAAQRNGFSDPEKAVISRIIHAVRSDPQRQFLSYSQDEPCKVSYARTPDLRLDSSRRTRTTLPRYIRRQLAIAPDVLKDHVLDALCGYAFASLDPGSTSPQFRFLKGKAISEAYRTGPGSCMSGSCSGYTELYALNPKHVQLMVLVQPVSFLLAGVQTTQQMKSRALLWTSDDGRRMWVCHPGIGCIMIRQFRCCARRVLASVSCVRSPVRNAAQCENDAPFRAMRIGASCYVGAHRRYHGIASSLRLAVYPVAHRHYASPFPSGTPNRVYVRIGDSRHNEGDCSSTLSNFTNGHCVCRDIIRSFRNWALRHDVINRASLTEEFMVTMEIGRFMPYMDTLCYGSYGCSENEIILSNISGDHTLNRTDGLRPGENSFCCDGCDTSIEGDDVYWAFDNAYCDECFHERYFHCDACGEAFSLDDRIDAGSGIYCRECASKLFVNCPDCGDYFRDEDTVAVCNSLGEQDKVCRSCATEYPPCGLCGNRFDASRLSEVKGIRYCSTCRAKIAITQPQIAA